MAQNQWDVVSEAPAPKAADPWSVVSEAPAGPPPLTVGSPQQVSASIDRSMGSRMQASPAESTPAGAAAAQAQRASQHPIVSMVGKAVQPVAEPVGNVGVGAIKGAAQGGLGKPEGAAEVIGSGVEGILEFVAGDEALKGLSMAEKLGFAGKLAKLAESHPAMAKIIQAGLNSARVATVGAAQGVAKGESPSEAAKTGVIAGATHGVLEGAAQGVKAIAPIVKDIAGTGVPARAEGKAAGIAEEVARTKPLQKLDVEQTQPAAKKAIRGIASKVPTKETSLAAKATTPARDFAERADQIRTESQPVFKKLDKLTEPPKPTPKIVTQAEGLAQGAKPAPEPALALAGKTPPTDVAREVTKPTEESPMKFSDWQKQERSAWRRGDVEAATKAKAAQEALMDKYSDQFDPKDFKNARANWRQASALERAHDAINTKSVIQPTPVNLRPQGTPDPGYIKGKAFSKQIMGLTKDGTLKTAGLSPAHIQALQDLGTLLEKSGSVQDQGGVLGKAVKAAKIAIGGPITAGGGYAASRILGRLMTDEAAATATVNALRSAVGPAAVAQAVRTPAKSDLDAALDKAGVPKNDDPYQRIIAFRSLKDLPEDTKAATQKAIAAFSNSLRKTD